MDLNFADLKKEAANAAADDVFVRTADAAKQTASNVKHDLLGGDGGDSRNSSVGQQDDNAHTEQYFANEQKDLNLEHVDPQTFVQRMSAGAKEAQEQLDAKFAQHTENFDDFFTNASKDLTNFGQQLKQDNSKGLASMTHDFMNAERGLFGGSGGGVGLGGAGDTNKVVEPKKTNIIEEDLLGVGDMKFKPSAPLASIGPTASQKMFDDDDFGTAAFGKSTASNKDSDTDSPLVSYNASPIKKPIVDVLKEQENEKFISSEDLLGDYKDERTATPEFKAAATKHTTAHVPTTDLDADDDDDNFMHDLNGKKVAVAVAGKHSDVEILKDLPAAPVVAPAAAIRPAPLIPEPVKTQTTVKAADKPTAVPAPAPAPAVAAVKETKSAATAAVKSDKNKQQQQPNIYVEELFYKYGLDAWFKPERLHPRVESLIYWRDVKKSGIVFGAGLISLLAVSCFSVISVFAYLSLLLLCGTIAFRIYKSVLQAVQKTSDGHPFKEYLEFDLTLSPEKIQNIVGVTVAHINGFTAELRRLFLVEDLVDSIKFGVILWVLTYIGAWFNGMTLVILAFVSLFTLPKVYENNKQSIDTYLDLVRSKLAEVTEKIKLAVPIGNKKPVAAEADKDK